MADKAYKNALTEICKLKRAGIFNQKNEHRWSSCLTAIADDRRTIIKNLHTVIRSELFIDSLPKKVYEYFNDDLRLQEIDSFFRNLQEYYSKKRENTELQRLRSKVRQLEDHLKEKYGFSEVSQARETISKLKTENISLKKELKDIRNNYILQIKVKMPEINNEILKNKKLSVKQIQNIKQVNSMEFEGIKKPNEAKARSVEFTQFKTTTTIQPFEICKNLPNISKDNKVHLNSVVMTNSVYNIIQDYYHKNGIRYDYINDIQLSDNDIINLVFECEESLGINIDDEILDQKTVSDFIDYIENKLN